jgi:Cu2+-exporting ATPase
MAQESAITLSKPSSGEGSAQPEKPIPCFHCGLPVPRSADYPVTILGKQHNLCCRGCEAVAQAIVDAGLEDFYRHRTEPSQRPEDMVPAALQQLTLYDREDVQQRFVRATADNLREASLILEGIVCAACVWLNERHVNALPGVMEFRVNYSTHRAHLQWDASQIRLSDVLAAIAAIGYQAHPFDPQRQESLQKKERAMALRRLAVAGVCGMQVMMLAVALYVGDYQGMDDSSRQFLRWVSLLLSIPVITFSARPFFSAAWRDLRHLSLGMDVPVALAIAGAFVASVWNTGQGKGEVYFDSVTMFTFLLLGSRFLEMTARHRAGRLAEEKITSLPATAMRLRTNGSEEVVAVAELAPEDRVRVRPGDTVPADGWIIEGHSSVDESLLSGESLPLSKGRGDRLVGGSVNVESPLLMRVDKVGAETVLSAIMRLLDRAQSEKPRIAKSADQVASWFVGALLLIAATVAGWWWQHAPSEAFSVTLSVLVVTCPCALSLATPAAITAALARLTRRGCLMTRGNALEALAKVTHVVFDKTGTLTHGRLQLVSVETQGRLDQKYCLKLAASLEQGSEHPIGQALIEANAEAFSVSQVRNNPGEGVEGCIDGIHYRLGKAEFVAGLSSASIASLKSQQPALTWIALGDAQGVLAWFGLADTLRPDAVATVAALQNLGIQISLLSGDQPTTVQTMAEQLGIANAEGSLLPADKLQHVKNLQGQGAVVAMVGDGVNDAPVLAGAQVSMAMGSGTAIAQTTADMVLLTGHLEVVVGAVNMARRTLSIIRQNIGWAIGYNVMALPLAATGSIAPWMAALGMSLSSLLVVANALRLRSG